MYIMAGLMSHLFHMPKACPYNLSNNNLNNNPYNNLNNNPYNKQYLIKKKQ